MLSRFSWYAFFSRNLESLSRDYSALLREYTSLSGLCIIQYDVSAQSSNSPRLHEISTYMSNVALYIKFFTTVKFFPPKSQTSLSPAKSCQTLTVLPFLTSKVRARHFQLTTLVASDNLNLTSQALKWRTLIRNRKTPAMEWLLKFLSVEVHILLSAGRFFSELWFLPFSSF